MLEAPVEGFEAISLILIVVGHEAAHFLLRHNDRRVPEEESLAEKRSLEMWADSFGTKLALTLVTYGASTGAAAAPFLVEVSLKQRLEAIGRAIGRLGESYFDTGSPHHPDAPTRVGMCVTGVTSFLDIELKSRVPKRSLWVMLRLYDNPAMEAMMAHTDESYLSDRSPIEMMAAVHREIQGEDGAIRPGVSPWMVRFVNLNFAVDPDERRRHVQAMEVFLERELAALFAGDAA
ncbi:hypothetical protein [Luteibacter sp. 9135]|jgi:hypothetical protein|uniref:hypothetical protein n=1 Tax=Luteibacter sp. 9135 TaxID=1500893 RepID=UPI0005686AA6|nr:hypothetical protein [Luteibacter sp. 9135]